MSIKSLKYLEINLADVEVLWRGPMKCHLGVKEASACGDRQATVASQKARRLETSVLFNLIYASTGSQSKPPKFLCRNGQANFKIHVAVQRS